MTPNPPGREPAPPPPAPTDARSQRAKTSRQAGLPWWTWDLAVAVLALAALLAWDAAGADLRVVQWFGTADGFPWRDRWLTAELLHTGGRWFSLCVLVALVVNVWRPLSSFMPGGAARSPQTLATAGRLPPVAAPAHVPPTAQTAAPGATPSMPRAARAWWLLATVACLLLIPAVKARSLVSCPWDLAQFGGAARHVQHWTMQAWFGPGDGGPGRCFPSGHASGAFSFITGWFVLRGASRRAAWAWVLAVCVLGFVFGAAQVARGAHYPSHVAWTAWMCWCASALAWHAARRVWPAATSLEAPWRAVGDGAGSPAAVAPAPGP